MKFDSYTLYARLFPGIVTSIPFFVLYFYYLNKYFSEFFNLIFGVKWVGDASTGIVFLFLLAFMGRSIAKDLFEGHWFKRDETRMPTTEFMLHLNNEYSDEFKDQLREKIRADFRIELLASEAEVNDEQKARKTIAEAITLIRNRLKDGRLLLSRNIEYGFIRNVIGCSVIAVLISIIDIIIFVFVDPNKVALVASISMSALYILPIVFSKKLFNNHGKRYARALFQEYMGS